MILAGIDEAGLGPNLGPLVTACAALRVPDAWLPETPWARLDAAFRREWRKTDPRPAVADSKFVYARGGMAALEKTVAVFSRLAGGEFSVSLSAAPHPCYSRAAEPFPLHCEREAIAAAEAEASARLAATGAGAARLDIACLFEPVMNSRFAAGLNKNQILLMETGARLAGLAAAFPGEPMLVVIDKQGGRNDYLPFLTALFPGRWPETAQSGAERSVYRFRREGGSLEIHFAAKGDRDSLATALASMAAKYARERHMAALNRWFGARAPGLRETAGYPADAKRWRSELAAKADPAALRFDEIWRIK